MLKSQDFFGEIGLIYECARTATVTSSNYSTLASLDKASYKELLIEFTHLEDTLKHEIYRYADRLKVFKMSSLRRVPYFSHASIEEEALHEIMYSMNDRHFNKGDLLLSPGEDANSLYIL